MKVDKADTYTAAINNPPMINVRKLMYRTPMKNIMGMSKARKRAARKSQMARISGWMVF